MRPVLRAGDRVRVQIKDRERYAQGAVERLDGRTGKLERFKADYAFEPMGAWLVTFDEPAPSWWSHGSPTTAFWFPASELARL